MSSKIYPKVAPPSAAQRTSAPGLRGPAQNSVAPTQSAKPYQFPLPSGDRMGSNLKVFPSKKG